MIAGRDFRHYAAEFFMLRSLRGHFAGEQLRAALAVSAAQDRHRGLVTRGFDRENCHKAVVIPSVVEGSRYSYLKLRAEIPRSEPDWHFRSG